jgi:hypothetical protein
MSFYISLAIFQNKLNIIMDDKSDDSSISMTMSEEEQESIQPTISIQPTTISNSKKKEKKGVFKKEWTLDKEFSSWLQAVKNDCKQARCKACLRTFSIREGKSALRKHMNTEIHKTHMKSFGNNILITHTSFGEAQKVSAMEGTFVYHGVKHAHSYISQQCRAPCPNSITIFKTFRKIFTVLLNSICLSLFLVSGIE